MRVINGLQQATERKEDKTYLQTVGWRMTAAQEEERWKDRWGRQTEEQQLMNPHSVNEWLQRNQSSPTASHTCQIRLSDGLLFCISCHQSVTEAEIHQSVVKTLDFKTMLRSSRGCLRPEFLLFFHNKSSCPQWSAMSWQEVARVVHTCHVCFHVLASCCVAWVCPSKNSVTAEL